MAAEPRPRARAPPLHGSRSGHCNAPRATKVPTCTAPEVLAAAGWCVARAE